MSRCHVRCRCCEARRVLRVKPDYMRTLPACKNCGARDYRVDGWMNSRDTRATACNCAGYVHMTRRECVFFAEVAQQINAAIPVTQWFSFLTDGNPERTGPYQVAYHKGDKDAVLRHFKDGNWFVSSLLLNKSCFGNKQSKEHCWRGLAEEPIVVKA